MSYHGRSFQFAAKNPGALAVPLLWINICLCEDNGLAKEQ